MLYVLNLYLLGISGQQKMGLVEWSQSSGLNFCLKIILDASSNYFILNFNNLHTSVYNWEEPINNLYLDKNRHINRKSSELDSSYSDFRLNNSTVKWDMRGIMRQSWRKPYAQGEGQLREAAHGREEGKICPLTFLLCSFANFYPFISYARKKIRGKKGGRKKVLYY